VNLKAVKPSSRQATMVIVMCQPFRSALPGAIHPQETPHTEEVGVVQAVATQQTALCRRETEFLTSDTLDPQQ
jgi:hypothetical protein